MRQLAIRGGRLGKRRSVIASGVFAVLAASLIAEGPHSAVADELSSGMPIPQQKPISANATADSSSAPAQVANIEQRPFFTMASLNLRTLAERVSDIDLFDGDLPLSREAFDAAQAASGNRPAFSLATLNLRTFAPPEREVAPIHVISDADAKRYRLIFDLQAGGDWDAADALISQLGDDILMGHVLYQRYMHPTAYRSSYPELRDWLADYADHPGATNVRTLAMKRKPAGEAAPARARTGRLVTGAVESYGFVPRRYRSDRERTREQRRAVTRLMRTISDKAERGSPADAWAILNQPANRNLLDKNEFNLMRAEVAQGYFHRRKYERAVELASASAKSNLSYLDHADWTVGLAHWKLGNYEQAANHFGKVASSNNVSPWKRSAGAFWAARSHRELGENREASQWLERAAKYPGTFYGLISTQVLDEPARFHWRTPRLNRDRLAVLQDHSVGARGLALIQVGQRELAVEELRRINPRRDRDLEEALVAIAEDAGLPDLAVRAGSRFRPEEGERYDTALYPIPPWSPDTGFQVDRALVFGFMRQESRFDPGAQSGVGASGLMQLMPRTAKYMGDTALYDGSDRKQLFDPLVNIELGQRYLAYLMESRLVGEDLLLLAAAYNAGPGNLQHWRRRVDYREDPLFFIESIPIKETRDFVERVLTNFWIYRMRFNQPVPSLEAIAQGDRPLYVRLDTKHIQVAAHGRN
ncbi:MAG: lytic transglycosylase domain-containing protein [Alphaproteobacteria bacterium]|nr:lytic transglycosylase domain-containing protein [Alphaproteobacteria bacterium SS10]